YDPPHGNYFAVKITDVNSCSDISDPILFYPVGLNEVPSNNSVVLFPNPVSDKLTCHFGDQVSSIEIRNLLGEEILSPTMNLNSSDHNLLIDVSTLPSST